MTIEEKRNKLAWYCDEMMSCKECKLNEGLDRMFYVCDFCEASDETVERMYMNAFPESSIKDSGNRRTFSTGSVRDIQEGKGRCDLLPLDVVADWTKGMVGEIFANLYYFRNSGRVGCLLDVLNEFMDLRYDGSKYEMLLEVSKHFEDGAKKYEIDNWKKGIPVRSYIDSGVRHLLKHMRGDNDEPHDRAFVWNIMCAIWTCKHKPELNDFSVEGGVSDEAK